MVSFFSQISWHVPTFQTCEANFSKPITDTDTMFSLKVAKDLRLHFRGKNSKKNSASWFFLKRSFEKTQFLRISYIWSLISQNQDQIQSLWFRILYKRFKGYTFAKKWRQFFLRLGFLGKKRDEKNVEIFFLICSSYSSNLTKHAETIPSRQTTRM